MHIQGVQRTLNKAKQGFFSRGQVVDVRNFVNSCTICHNEKSNHTLSKSQLQNLELQAQKWQKVTIDFITDLTEFNEFDLIMTFIDKAIGMTHIIPRNKTMTVQQTA